MNKVKAEAQASAFFIDSRYFEFRLAGIQQ